LKKEFETDPAAAVKKLRKKKGWSVADLAELVARSPRTIENWEQGRRAIPAAALKRLIALSHQ